MDDYDFDFGGSNDFDYSSYLGDSGSTPDIDFSGFDNLDISSLLGGDQGIDFSQVPGDFGSDLGSELAAALQDTGDSSSLFSGDGGIDLANLLGNEDAPAPPAGMDEMLNKIQYTDTGDPETTWEKFYSRGMQEGLDESNLDKLSPEERARYDAMKSGDTSKRDDLMSYMNERKQDFGGADVMQYFDEYDKNMTDIMQNKGGFTSQWQNVGGNKVMVNDDPVGGSTATVFNPTTGQTSYLTEEQTKALIDNGTLNTKASGYVDATGGKGYIPGGAKTFDNGDGTKTVITTGGNVLKVDDKGNVTDTGKKVDVNDKSIETKTIKEIINNTKTIDNTKTGTQTKPADKKDNTGMLMALLALMAMMNKGGGSSTGSGGTIPSLQANRSQLPYGPATGSTARPGAGGVNYFSPTTYTQKAAGGGMMYGGGGISDLGGYSDGGRLLKGPGDGVSDSIPATIGGKQPARLAEGEFVVPARIVSELGNGSTEAGAKKLYAMMDRVQKARRKTKNVAADTKAHKYLPA